MPLYESVFIARQDVSSGQVEALTEAFTKVVTDNGGQVVRAEPWGLRSLSYRIRKNKKGHYVMLNLDVSAAVLAELERAMRLSEDVIRYMTIRVDALEEGPSVMMQARAARTRRDGVRPRDGEDGGEEFVAGEREVVAAEGTPQ